MSTSNINEMKMNKKVFILDFNSNRKIRKYPKYTNKIHEQLLH